MDFKAAPEVIRLYGAINDMNGFHDDFAKIRSDYNQTAQKTESVSALIDSITGDLSLSVFDDAESAISTNVQKLQSYAGGLMHDN